MLSVRKKKADKAGTPGWWAQMAGGCGVEPLSHSQSFSRSRPCPPGHAAKIQAPPDPGTRPLGWLHPQPLPSPASQAVLAMMPL